LFLNVSSVSNAGLRIRKRWDLTAELAVGVEREETMSR
jgi:hypothetical protein